MFPFFSVSRRRSVLIILACTACAAIAPGNFCRAQDASDSVEASLADGTTFAGSLRSIAGADAVLFNQRPVRVAIRDLIAVEFRGHRRLPWTRTTLIQLANGDRIAAGLATMSGEAVVALWKSYADWPPVRIPAETISGILVTVPHGAAQRSRAMAQVFGRREKSDVVLLANGDRVAGDLASFDQSILKLTQAGQPLQIDASDVRGVAFNSTLSNFGELERPRVQVALTDGSLLTGSGASLESGGPLKIRASYGSTLEIPLSAVASLRFLDGRAVYLSDLTPERAILRDYFGSTSGQAAANDHNLMGGSLVVHGVEYAKGIGTRSQSEVTFDLAGQFRRFQSLAALDDLSEGRGSVRFAVELDNVRVFTSAVLTGSSPPLVVGPINLTGKRRLTLIVEFGELADVNDWADWCNALVVR